MRSLMIPVRLGALAVLLGATAAAAQAGECSGGLPAFGSLGIEEFRCVGGACAVNMRSGDPYAHSFSTEPRISKIDPSGPGSNVLRSEDVLVSVDGRLITTAEGGRRLGSIRPGQAVELTLRRDGREISARIQAVSSCELPRLTVTSGSGWQNVVPTLGYSVGDSALVTNWNTEATTITHFDSIGGSYVVVGGSDQQWNRADSLSWSRPLYMMADSSGLAYGITTGPLATYDGQNVLATSVGVSGFSSRPPVEFGVELSCGDCGWRRAGPIAVFRTGAFPTIESVEKDGPADRAGLLPGDVMISVEGLPITAIEAGRRLGALEPAEAVSLEIRRGDRIIEVSLTPREATRRRQRM
jgi:hypothetical protein